jgi:hypothetical protein
LFKFYSRSKTTTITNFILDEIKRSISISVYLAFVVSWFYKTFTPTTILVTVFHICTCNDVTLVNEKSIVSWKFMKSNKKTHYLRSKHFIITITDDPSPCYIGLAEKYMLFKGSNNLVQIYRSFVITGNYGRLWTFWISSFPASLFGCRCHIWRFSRECLHQRVVRNTIFRKAPPSVVSVMENDR